MLENEILKEYGSPVYMYDESILRKRINEMMKLASALESELGVNIKMHYSTKANGNIELLKIVKELGMAIDSMSPLELKLTELAGFKKDDILYVCNNISQEEMKMIVDKEILLCLDSISQVEMLGKIRPNTKIMIRINPGEFGVGHSEKVITSGKETKFGISENNFNELFETAKKYNLKIIGVHQHLGSSFLNESIGQYISGVKTGLEIIKKYFNNLEVIDLGGGFGVPYKEDEERLDLNLLKCKLLPVLREFLSTYKVKELKFEPGRYISCESGYILGKVNSIKNENGKIWIGTDVGMNVLIRPSMYNAYHKIEILKLNNDKDEYITATIVGNICESGDIIGKDRKIKKPEVGDIVKIYNSGAYGYSMSSSYTGRTRPAELLQTVEGKIKLIRKRETIEDIINSFIK